MTVYTDVFGGTTIYPSDVSYLALALTADTTLSWPLDSNAGADIAARIIDVTPTGAYSILMPPADETSVGQTTLFNNLGPSTVTVKDSTGTVIASLGTGEQWQIYLRDNSTAAGLWRVFRYGAATAQAQASALAGYGLATNGSTLMQASPVVSFSANYTIGAADRASLYAWTGGAGVLTFLSAASAGNGYFLEARNAGTGNLVLTPAGSDNINGASTLTLRPGDSVTAFCTGTTWYTVGYGQSAVFAFDFTVINLAAVTSPYTLSGAELNRIAYSFTGLLTGNKVIVVPSTTQQYWISNDTTGAYTVGFRTSTQVTPVEVPQGARGIYYSDGSDVVNADTASIATPIAIADGGTGATTAGAALINLGGTSVGIAVFTAANAAAARTAINAASPEDAQLFAVAIS